LRAAKHAACKHQIRLEQAPAVSDHEMNGKRLGDWAALE